jgi:hypothetical protein
MKNACRVNYHTSHGVLFSYRDKFTLLYCDMLRYVLSLAGGSWALDPPGRNNHLQMSRAMLFGSDGCGAAKYGVV